ncbi:hypothetical protein IWQ62_001903 [Dispira parvispora]|uniref:Uncharacterized protein n=1 Tax=Dispira parvispora TaxID=1520584 RepID=A0A9W8ASI8_9FUNG|nr:hypothetical protein IWQ62_001903 [Dispira parvispora]
MCRRTTCDKCHKPSYMGCGRHIEQVLGDVPKDQRCKCREQNQTASTGEFWLMRLALVALTVWGVSWPADGKAN